METTTREMQTRQRGPAPSNGDASAPRATDRQTQTGPPRPATRGLYGCAHGGCLEIAKPDAHHCPLHE